jgi:predicted HicB family RNase H-like nuclease
MAECVATVSAHVSQDMLDAILKDSEPLRLTPGQWLKSKLIEITGVKVSSPPKPKKATMSHQLYVRLPGDLRKKMADQAALEGMTQSQWLRRAVERELTRLPGSGDILQEAPRDDEIAKYPMAYFRGTPELRERVVNRVKAEGMSQSTWVRCVIQRELGLLGQLMLDLPLEWLEASEVSEEDMPEEEWERLAEASLKPE